MTYSNVRLETHITRDYLVIQMAKLAHVADVWHDGSDLVMLTFQSGEKFMCHLIETPISLHELGNMLHHNTAKGLHSLFLFWADMLLPQDGERFIPQAWMQATLALYDDQIYAYEVSKEAVYIFPVHFEAQLGYPEHYIRWGNTLPLQGLRAEILMLESPHLTGQFRRANFVVAPSAENPQPPPVSEHRRVVMSTHLQAHYQLLKLPYDASSEQIRQAYRALARQFHPDLNTSLEEAEATEKMQALNRAYQQIMAQFESD